MRNRLAIKRQKPPKVINWALRQIAKGLGIGTEEIRYFHPSGRKFLPNGSHYHRGGFIRECNLNANAFVFPENDNSEPIRDKKSGGILVFNNDIKLKSIIDAISNIDIENFRIGNFFEGEYLDSNRMMFNNTSVTLALPNHSFRKLLQVAESIIEEIGLTALLAMDLVSDKLYIIR